MIEKKQNQIKPVKYRVDSNGSLGLLAAGHKGLRAWREARDEMKHSKREEK
jgi:hypothetical protein